MSNPYSTNPDDLGISVISGTTGLGEITPQELEKKVEDTKENLRSKKNIIMDEFWTAPKSDAIDELREKNPPFKMDNQK